MMHNKGLTKLLEELGELSQIVAKKAAYIDVEWHPDNKGNMHRRIEEEMADVIAAITFVGLKFNLDIDFVEERSNYKLDLFQEWDKLPD